MAQSWWIIFLLLSINSLQNTNNQEYVVSIPKIEEFLYTEKGGRGNKMSVSDKIGS